MDRLRCAILDDYQQVALSMADWSTLAPRVEVVALADHLADEEDLAHALTDREIIVVMRERTPVSARLLSRLPRLRLIVTSGMRNGAIDLPAAQAQGVVVCGTKSSSAPPTELTWALILGLARQVASENAVLRAGGPWQRSLGVDLHGKRLGLVGLGKIGSRVARIGSAFGMEVVGWSPNLTAARASAAGARLATKEELFETSDFVSLHLQLSASTRGVVGAAELKHMHSEAFLINTARAGLVDQAALLAALRARRIAGAGLDVFEIEPLPLDHPYRSLPNVLATPHLGYVTRANYEVYFREAIEDITAFLEGAPLRLLTPS